MNALQQFPEHACIVFTQLCLGAKHQYLDAKHACLGVFSPVSAPGSTITVPENTPITAKHQCLAAKHASAGTKHGCVQRFRGWNNTLQRIINTKQSTTNQLTINN